MLRVMQRRQFLNDVGRQLLQRLYNIVEWAHTYSAFRTDDLPVE